jgi:hypothetical protein
MSIRDFVEQSTIPTPGVGVSVARVRREYQQKHGPIPRTQFLIELAGSGYALLTTEGRTFLSNRALAAEPAAALTGEPAAA